MSLKTKQTTSTSPSRDPGPGPAVESRDPGKLPAHVAIIMDGNGRWAQKQGMPRIEGHRKGGNTVRKIVRAAAAAGVRNLTLYCLSSENWKRPEEELSFLMYLLKEYLVNERQEILDQNLRFRTIGRTSELSGEIQEEIRTTMDLSADNAGMTLCLALNYGARGEIVDAVRKLARQVEDGTLSPESIDEHSISDALDTAGMPDPDLVIRTAGEMRMSNFLLWQISYAELWVTQKHWPDFSEDDFSQALDDFIKRERRFGGLKSPPPNRFPDEDSGSGE